MKGKEKRGIRAVIGIGASAGGLAALKQFFSHVPKDSGLAFVVVVHLSPEHKSHLAELLQPHVKNPVQQVSETTSLEPNHIYVIPPNANLNAIDTHLRLSPLEEQRLQRAPIDHFFRTLSATHDGSAVAVILTGTGSDGTLGVKEINAKGGMTIAQDPTEAEYDGMPQSAIATGTIDLVLPIAKIYPAIAEFVGTEPKMKIPQKEDELAEQGQYQLLHRIFAHLIAVTGRDFSRYKRSTLLRRIQRRMQLRHIEELGEYVDILRETPEEASALANEFLITVTDFFRDPQVFQRLQDQAIPSLFAKKGPDQDLRVWVAGCASGEEAYSLAILLAEEARRCDAPPRIQVFASDLHEPSLERARQGFYPGDIETQVSPERLNRFFTHEEGGYRIHKDIRELVVFTPHNLLSDPPFSRVDLIACRNLLIYLQRDVQREVIELFHYALRPEGILLLGTAETLGASELFDAESKNECIYRKRSIPAPEPRLPVFPFGRGIMGPPTADASNLISHSASYNEVHLRMVERYAPPSLLVTPEDKVGHLSEHAGRYLVHPGGEITASVYKLVREELRIELRAALHSARQSETPILTKPVRVHFDGTAKRVSLHVRAALDPQQKGYVLVIFEESGDAPESLPASSSPSPGRAAELEAELDLTRQRLQVIIEEFETSQEEMKASNEELQSANEELRSTMEELETSKEELQSLNEELQTANQENRHRVAELSQLTSDLNHLLTSTDIATLFLDRELRIMRFTPKVSELFNVRATDRGRPLSDITNRLGDADLMEDSQTVLDRLIPIEREVTDESNQWYLTRILPYRSGDDRIEGVVLTFVDITNRKENEELLRLAKNHAETILDSMPEPLLVLDADLRVTAANRAFYDHFQVDAIVTEGELVYRLGNNQWNSQELRRLLEEVLPNDQFFRDYEIHHNFEHLGPRVMLLSGRRLEFLKCILLSVRDITDRKNDEKTLRELNEQLEERVQQRTRQVRQLASRLTCAEQEERRRIASILHDDLQQILCGVQTKVEWLREQNLQPADLSEVLDDTGLWLQRALKTTRQLTMDLNPPILKDEGLPDILRWLQHQMAELHELDIEIDIDSRAGEPTLQDENLRVLLFHIVRELLFNVKKHSGTGWAKVNLEENGEGIILRVIDEGCGMDLAKIKNPEPGATGYGLFNARERLRLMGGELTVRSEPGQGTYVEVRVPSTNSH